MLAVIVLGPIFSVFLIAHLVQWITQSSDEPPIAEKTIPFVEPIVQMLRNKSQFHLQMRWKYYFPAHTLRLPGIRIYVLNQLPLITAAQKQHHVLSFGPIMGQAIGRISGTSVAANKVMAKDVLTDDGFLLGFNKAIYHTMAPGTSLDTLTKRAASTFLARINRLCDSAPMTPKVPLFAWIRSTVLHGTTDAVYGAQNPFHDPIIEASWYTFEPGVTTLAMRFIPLFATRKTRQARALLVGAFTKYFSAGCPEEASDFMKARYEHIVKHQITDIEDIAKLEVAGAFSIITNTAPCAFWLLYHIYSNPTVLEDCRAELSLLVHERNNARYLDINAITTSCPVLYSTFQEAMRYYGAAQSMRMVLADYKLDNTYLLKRGGLVMMPATVQHFDPSVWGLDVNHFDYKRFTRLISDENRGSSDSKPRVHGAFRGFGGGSHLCPGRHFAKNEILSLAALFVLRFDLVPTTGQEWPDMGTSKLSSKGSAIIIPDNDLHVTIIPRGSMKLVIV